ncbi:DMT family transporter [Thalassovita mediterranea]|uniref:Carboxylate/amino acid/amine transporter n=1 Tax=Thalassovita mediterranea TaxID=340021 RepID=A0A0P1GPX6_9RHOB|nr:DMT family transporter [Thalassovita mediterranea]CUH84614.1 carboxylate/amino acid/amine transporter [Thalassovita mediterranea]SIS32264.1 Permease of the drug/metabolite transporter (DMT) superfamily [Thalassovita mediterranea]
MNLSGAFYALVAFGLFATHDVVIKYLGSAYAPAQVLFFATLFSFPLVSLMLMRDKTAGTLLPVYPGWNLIRTLAATGNALCVFYAFTALPLAQVYAILFAMPLLITLLAIPMLGEKVGLHRGAAILVGLCGVIIVLRPGSAELGLGHAAALSSACLGSLVFVISRKVGQEERPVVMMLYPLAANFVVMGGIMVFDYRPVALPDLAGMGAIALLGFVAGLLLVFAYRASEAAVVAPMQYSQILWATVYGLVFFDEHLDRATVLGVGVIIASGLYILFREARGGHSENMPVLRNRSRVPAAMSMWIGAVLRRGPRG